VGGAKRSPTLPDVPTIAEAGVPGYEAVNWWGLLTPAGTPPEIIARVHKEIGVIQHQPEIQKRFETEAMESMEMSSAAFGKYIQEETLKWARVVKEAGVQAQ
jgi:tripartite-type tricarboxylate transporter receptor subunit TctC